jgi:hypothetical protein
MMQSLEHSTVTRIIIGIDLSYNSTGMTVAKWAGNVCKTISFHRLVFDKVPTPVKNLNQQTYRMPTNVRVDDLVTLNGDDFYSEDQAHITLKAMVCVKRLLQIIVPQVDKHVMKLTTTEHPNEERKYGPEVHFNIEGFVMPSMVGGSQQLRTIGGLIMLQGMLRSELIKYRVLLGQHIKFKITITSPSELKLFFAGFGSAEKFDMLDSFIQTFGGSALLPDTESLAKVNDVVDSYALMLNSHWRQHTEKQRKISKSQKKHEEREAKKKTKNKKKSKVHIPILYI